MPPKKPFVGIDLGGTNMQIGVVSPDFKLLGSSKKKTKAEEGVEGVLSRIVEATQEACAAAKVSVGDLGGLGIGAPGAVDPYKGFVLEAVNLRWTDVPLAQLLTKQLKVPVFVDNDVNVAVVGEHRLGAGKGVDDLLGVWVGTGIGGGLILNGKLYEGTFFSAGEIGHTIALPGALAGHRSLEHNCSRTAVVDRLVRLIQSNRKSKIMAEVEGDTERIKSRTIGKAYKEGDALVVEVVDESADLLGIAIANVVTLLSLPRVVLGGGLTEAIGKPYVERVQRMARKTVFPEACRKVDVVASMLEDNAGVYGAAMLAMDRS